jgi:hypothetical protein
VEATELLGKVIMVEQVEQIRLLIEEVELEVVQVQ